MAGCSFIKVRLDITVVLQEEFSFKQKSKVFYQVAPTGTMVDNICTQLALPCWCPAIHVISFLFPCLCSKYTLHELRY